MHSRREAGVSNVISVIGVMPIVVLVFALCLDAGVTGYAWARADAAARAGALAVGDGGDPREAALASLSARLAAGARVDVEPGEVRVSVVPTTLLGTGRLVGPISAAAQLAPQGRQ